MSSSKSIAWAAWAVASIFYAYQYILRVMPNIILPDIMQQFNIDAAVFGQMSGVYYIGYALVHIPIGILLDRFGPKRVMPLCMLLMVAGLIPLIASTHWVFPLVGRALVGIGSSAAILGIFKIVRMTFAEARFSRMLSISVTIGLIGALYGGGPLSQLHAAYGYQFLVELLMMMGIGLAVVSYFILPHITPTPHDTVWAEIIEVLQNKKVIATCLLAGLMVGPLEGFADVWGSSFLKTVYHYDDSVAGYLPSMTFFGMCFGAVLLVLIAEKTNSTTGSIIGAGLVMTAFFIALLLKLLTQPSMTIGFVIVGICCAYQILAIYKASTYVPERLSGLATTVANMIIMLFGYSFHSMIGGAVEYLGGINNVDALIGGISVVPITLAIGVIGFIILATLDRKTVSV